MTVANVNWNKVKNEYITTDISQRKIAEKYNIPRSTLENKARKEKWKDERDKYRVKLEVELRQKTADKIVKIEVDRIANVIALSDLLAEKIKIAIEQLDNVVVDGEPRETGIVDTYKLRQVVQCTKDLKDIVRGDSDSNDIKRLDAVLDKIEGNI